MSLSLEPGMAAVTAGPLPASAPRRPSISQRFLRNRLSVTGLVLLAAVIVLTIILPVIGSLDPTAISLTARLQPPSWDHLMGTDALGRDLLARVAYGGRLTLAVGLAGVALALLLGVALGLASGYFGGWFDALTMRIVDLVMAFPSMLLAVVVAAILGIGVKVIIVAICVFMVPNFARLTRGLALSLRERDYVRAARGMGASDAHILLRHILPNCLGPIAVQSSLNSAWGILSVAWMSYLGFGPQSPTAELGSMVSDGRAFLLQAPFYSGFPGLVITVIVLALNFIGDGLRDAFDIRGS